MVRCVAFVFIRSFVENIGERVMDHFMAWRGVAWREDGRVDFNSPIESYCVGAEEKKKCQGGAYIVC